MMKMQRQKCWTIVCPLLCLALMAGVLYYEPVTALNRTDDASSRPLSIYHALIVDEVEAEPEVCAYKYEMSVTRSIRDTSLRRVFKKHSDYGGDTVQRANAYPVFIHTTVDRLRFYAGADNQFLGMINYIWNQTGL